MILCDTNVIVDLLTDSPWAGWVASQFEDYAKEHEFAINPIIYAEVSVPFPSADSFELSLATHELVRLDLPWEAAFLAGKVFHAYRQRGGPKTSPLPDFFIGAHAQVSGLILLTRDGSSYRTYFPTIQLVVPR
jgi:predicted nucleic acid-binding protein